MSNFSTNILQFQDSYYFTWILEFQNLDTIFVAFFEQRIPNHTHTRAIAKIIIPPQSFWLG